MLELAIIKQHCRLEPDFTDDDELLDTYADAATRYVENHTDRKLYATLAEVPVDDEDQPIMDYALVMGDDIAMAMLLLIGHWYDHRSAVVVGTSTSPLPMAVESLLQPYKVYGV